MTQTEVNHASTEYEHQVSKLSLGSTQGAEGSAVKAKFITPLDPVVETSDGSRLPAVPVREAHKLNILKDSAEGKQKHTRKNGRISRLKSKIARDESQQTSSLDQNLPPLRTHPLFPPLPLYGPPTLARDIQCIIFRITAFFLSTAFLLVIVAGAVFTAAPRVVHRIWLRATFRNPARRRPFFEEEQRRAANRKAGEQRWNKQQSRKRENNKSIDRGSVEPSPAPEVRFAPSEGGRDKLICDIGYYARRVGLDVEAFKVQTEDGFIIDLWHIYDPAEHTPSPLQERKESGPEVFQSAATLGEASSDRRKSDSKRKYPLLLMHGLLQSAGAYCTNDDDSLAFYLCKSGYDVWLGNNRCGFHPEHALLQQTDPRMWAWNIRQMGVMDLPALVSRVLEETNFPKLGLICHSQGTTQTFVALAKEQRPELGEKISVFCALAPAVYAGPLIGKMYFKFMRIISPSMFRMFFGIHSFIPLMMTAHSFLPPRWYGMMGYLVFSFLFNWSDARWDRGLRDRLFLFAPVYVSAESMRWWLGRECFAKHKCVLSTKEEWRKEEQEDAQAANEESRFRNDNDDVDETDAELTTDVEKPSSSRNTKPSHQISEDKSRSAWYPSSCPPIALWICGSDDLVDGRRLLRRFERGREPNVNIVHSKVIPEYEHLDVLWAIDSIEKVGKEVKEVVWNTIPDDLKGMVVKVDGVGENVEKGLGTDFGVMGKGKDMG